MVEVADSCTLVVSSSRNNPIFRNISDSVDHVDANNKCFDELMSHQAVHESKEARTALDNMSDMNEDFEEHPAVDFDGRLSAIMPRSVATGPSCSKYKTSCCKPSCLLLQKLASINPMKQEIQSNALNVLASTCNVVEAATAVCRKLFQDDAAVRSGLLQVYVRMKAMEAGAETCMKLDQDHMLKATW